MTCPHCSSLKIANRSRLTAHGYKTFFCKNCKRTFNERTGTPFNRSRLQTTTLFKVGDKFHYLYRGIDSRGKLVDTKLSPERTLESTSAFLKEAVVTVGHKPEQVTTDKEV